MNHPSQLTTALFIVLVAIVAALVVRAIIRVGRGGEPQRPVSTAGTFVTGGLLVFYLLIPAVLARAGALSQYTPLPAPALVLILALTVLTISLAMSGFGARLASSVGLAGLVGFQAFRVPVEWLLHRLFLEGVVPVQMTYSGRNFDIISGLTAATLGLGLARGWHIPRGWLLTWNVIALGLLANIVIVAVLSTPVPFRRFLEGPPNLLPSMFPYVWLPTFLVQVALCGHLLVFRSGARKAST